MFFSKPETKPDLTQQRDKLDEMRKSAGIYISFKQLASRGYTTFSVERKYDNVEHTCVSCIDRKGESVDFFYECSLQQHNDIVADFIKFCNETNNN